MWTIPNLNDAVVDGGLEPLGSCVGYQHSYHDRYNVGNLARQLKHWRWNDYQLYSNLAAEYSPSR